MFWTMLHIYLYIRFIVNLVFKLRLSKNSLLFTQLMEILCLCHFVANFTLFPLHVWYVCIMYVMYSCLCVCVFTCLFLCVSSDTYVNEEARGWLLVSFSIALNLIIFLDRVPLMNLYFTDACTANTLLTPSLPNPYQVFLLQT